jgi:hypothetical protein
VAQPEEPATEKQEHVNARPAGQVVLVLVTMEKLGPPVIESLAHLVL